ncbi:MAG: hypothetical protein HUU56_13510 [Bdellovibrionaceae bacterium]|nr:hypothetical protein [Pseudobdellovibrionaceae bacterium]
MEFNYEGKSQDFPSSYLNINKIESDYQKTYKKLFQSLSVPELDHCKIEVQFKILNGYWGSVETEKSIQSKTINDCSYEIKIDEQLIDKMEGQLVLIHELVHIIRHHFNPLEERWLDEGLAQLIETEYIALWPYDKQTQLFSQEKLFLSSHDEDYSPKGRGYSSSYFFLKYMYNHFGGLHLVKKLLTSQKTGWSNIQESLKQLSEQGKLQIPKIFFSKEMIWTHFSFAIFFNDSAKADYGLFLLDYKFKNDTEKKSPLINGEKRITSNTEMETFYLPLNKVNKQMLAEIDFNKFSVYLLNSSSSFNIVKADSSMKLIRALNQFEYAVLVKKL